MKSKAGGRRGGLPRPALYGRGVIRMGEERGLLESLLLELRRGTLVLSVLSQMDVPRYGYSLVQCMEEKVVAIDPNTLYPLLRRLERQGLLESRWETDGSSPFDRIVGLIVALISHILLIANITIYAHGLTTVKTYCLTNTTRKHGDRRNLFSKQMIYNNLILQNSEFIPERNIPNALE